LLQSGRETVGGFCDDVATMEDNTPQQLAIDLKSFLPEGEQPRKVSTIGCSSDVCDKGGKSFVSNLKESLQNEGINMSGYFDFKAFF
jgi:hypothetical protein